MVAPIRFNAQVKINVRVVDVTVPLLREKKARIDRHFEEELARLEVRRALNRWYYGG